MIMLVNLPVNVKFEQHASAGEKAYLYEKHNKHICMKNEQTMRTGSETLPWNVTVKLLGGWKWE